MKKYRIICSLLFSNLWIGCLLLSFSNCNTILGEVNSPDVAIAQDALTGETAIQQQQENSDELLKPTLSHLNPDSTLSENEVKDLIKAAIRLKLSTVQDPINTQQAIEKFLQAANSKHGDIVATYHLGDMLEKRGNIALAVRWYTLSFQNGWLEDPEKAYQSLAYDALRRLGQKNIFLTHPQFNPPLIPSSFHFLTEKLLRLCFLIDFYKNQTFEPYLTHEENLAKIHRLSKEKDKILENNPQLKYFIKSCNSELEKGIKCMSTAPKKAEKIFKELQFAPDGCRNLAVLYENFYKGEKLYYQKAVELYKKSGEPDSFFFIGRLYSLGLVKGQPNEQKAEKWFKLSGTPDAWCSLGCIYAEREDYLQAQAYLEKSNNGRAHYQLAVLYYQGVIGPQAPQADYILAKKHLELAIEKAYLSRPYHDLAMFYYHGFLGERNYKLAIEYLQKAINIPSDDISEDLDNQLCTSKQNILNSLGVIYMKGKWGSKHGKPNFNQAKNYLEQAGLPKSYYSLGHLYELGHIKSDYSFNPDSKQQPTRYKTAIKHYYMSGLVSGLLRILCLYQLELVTPTLKEKEKLINQINDMLPSLTLIERYYIQGCLGYYLGNWENAYIALEQALALQNPKDTKKSRELKEIHNIVDEILKYFEKQSTLGAEEDEEVNKSESFTTSPAPGAPGTPLEKKDQEREKQQITLPAVSRLTKEQKKIIRSQKRRLAYMASNPLVPIQPAILSIEFEFLSSKQEEDFSNFQKVNSKISEILEDLKTNAWNAAGVGKPEVLKGLYQGYRGCLSRRINTEDRLVYKVTGPGRILILSWEGHYDE